MTSKPQRCTVTTESAGSRLDQFVAAQLDLGRRAVWRMLEEGAIALQGRTLTVRDKGRRLLAGQNLTLRATIDPATTLPEPRPDLPLTVLAGDADGIIVAKPAGQAVHPLNTRQRDTLLNAALARHEQLADVGEGGLRSGVVHRLDVATSGCVALALTEHGYTAMREAITEHRAVKRYHALVHGTLDGEGEQSAWLVMGRHRPAHVKVVTEAHAQARCCRQHWRALGHHGDQTLVQVELDTGFLHQIRVLMAHLGHPVVGDALYGPDADPTTRLMLHASHLDLGIWKATAPLPEEMACEEPDQLPS